MRIFEGSMWAVCMGGQGRQSGWWGCMMGWYSRCCFGHACVCVVVM